MSNSRRVTVYTDYKSPYAYLAKDLAYALERDLPVQAGMAALRAGHLEHSLGSARVDDRWQCSGSRIATRISGGVCVQLHGLSAPGAQTWAGHSRHAEDLGFDAWPRPGCCMRSTPAMPCSAATTTRYSNVSGGANWISRMSPSSPLCWRKPAPMAAAFAAQAQAGRRRGGCDQPCRGGDRRVRRAELRGRWRAVLGQRASARHPCYAGA